MTITPDQARELLNGATPSPWRFTECESIIPFRVDFWDDDEMGHKNADLAAAAPDMATTIAGMKWEWRIEEWSGSYWYPCGEWDADGSVFDGYTPRWGERLVRRLVGPVETVEEA